MGAAEALQTEEVPVRKSCRDGCELGKTALGIIAQRSGVNCQALFEAAYAGRSEVSMPEARALFVRYVDTGALKPPEQVLEFCNELFKKPRRLTVEPERSNMCMACNLSREGWATVVFSYRFAFPKQMGLNLGCTRMKNPDRTPDVVGVKENTDLDRILEDMIASGALDDGDDWRFMLDDME